jgi:hypothetical protein
VPDATNVWTLKAGVDGAFRGAVQRLPAQLVLWSCAAFTIAAASKS